MADTTLYHVHDPMCSWCWGFRSTWQQFQSALPSSVTVIRLLGGLAPDSEEPMPAQMQQYLQQTWRHIESTIPGVRFNHAFWQKCQPRRSTYPACRAVIAARLQGEKFDEEMTYAIQRAYYLEAKNPSDNATLVGLAKSLNLDEGKFSESLNSPLTQQTLQDEIRMAYQLGIQGFPGIVLTQGDKIIPIKVNYNDADQMLAALGSVL